jgi:hypothetical protein
MGDTTVDTQQAAAPWPQCIGAGVFQTVLIFVRHHTARIFGCMVWNTEDAVAGSWLEDWDTASAFGLYKKHRN